MSNLHQTSYVRKGASLKDIYMLMFSYGHSCHQLAAGLTHIMDYDTFLYIYLLNAYCLPVPVFLKPPVGGAGCEVPSIAACSFNYSDYSSFFFSLLLQT